MRKKVIICLCTSLALAGFLFSKPLVVNAADAAEPTIVEAAAGVKPDSFLYWIDTIFERISIWLQKGVENEVPRLLELAEEKLAEVEALALTDPVAAGEAAERYEKYLKEAVKKTEKAQKKENVDDLLQDLSDASMTHITAFVAIGAKAASMEQPYIDEAFDVIKEQEKNVLGLIQDDEKRTQAIEDILAFLKDQEEKIPPEIRDSIKTTLEDLITEIAQFVIDKGGDMLDSLSDQALEFARDQANQQLDKAKDSLIEKIEDIEL